MIILSFSLCHLDKWILIFSYALNHILPVDNPRLCFQLLAFTDSTFIFQHWNDLILLLNLLHGLISSVYTKSQMVDHVYLSVIYSLLSHSPPFFFFLLIQIMWPHKLHWVSLDQKMSCIFRYLVSLIVTENQLLAISLPQEAINLPQSSSS